jgi:phosphohistidine swiveling domain-containing protein
MMIDPGRALARARNEPVVLFRSHATPEDVAAVRAAQALVTTSGGLTCHAAVIARGLGVPAVVGCGELRIDEGRAVVLRRNEPDGVLFREGDPVSVDAHRGVVYPGRRGMVARVISPEVQQLALELRKLRPHPLWAVGAPEVSLRAKEEMSLDGILCPVSSADELSGVPRGRGRECWLVLPADRALELLGSVPGGWGIAVRGELGQIPFEALRARTRLTPLGVYLDAVPERAQVPIALDLAVAGADVGQPERLSGLAPRLLLWANSTLDSARLSHAKGIGVLCETERSYEWVLRLALQRPIPTFAH